VLKGSSVMLLTLVPGASSGVSPAAMTLARAAVTRL
jgi:NADPH:quinone reductase-like Zn-dependent oxidoreductase